MKKKKAKNNNIKSCTLYVDGMHCAACEVIVEKKLLENSNVKSVDASLSSNIVVVHYEGSNKPDIDEMNKKFHDLGYKFSNNKNPKKKEKLFEIHKGQVKLNTEKVSTLIKGFAIALGILIAFYLFEGLQLARYVSVDSTSSLPAFFVLGVVAGISSCAALIGGLVLSMSKQWNDIYTYADSKATKASPHIMFHIGRIVSFGVLGAGLGLIGERISLNNLTFYAILTILVSIVMLVLAMQMLGVGWAQNLKFTLPKSVTKFVADESNFKGKYMPVTIGALTFFLPCGFTLIAQTIALSSGSAIQGGLIMLFFALGTLPTLLAISFSGLLLNSKPHLTARFNVVAGIIIVFFAIYNINGQMNVLGLPSLNDISFDQNREVQEQVAVTNGLQEIRIIAEGFDYIPDGSLTLQAGIPATLVVDNRGIQGCAAFVAANGLIDNFVTLKPGINEIDLGEPRLGTYKLTCSMGMVKPLTIRVI